MSLGRSQLLDNNQLRRSARLRALYLEDTDNELEAITINQQPIILNSPKYQISLNITDMEENMRNMIQEVLVVKACRVQRLNGKY